MTNQLATSRVDPTLLRRLNERKLLELIQLNGAISRARLSRVSGLSAPTVSKVISQFLEQGLLEELDDPVAAFGRPAKLVRISADRTIVLGVVIDVAQCSVVVSGLDGKLDPQRVRIIDTPKSYETLLSQIEIQCRELLELSDGECLGLGISVPGLMSKHGGQVVLSPNLRMLDGHHPGHDLSAVMNLPCSVLQESHALCIAERMFGGAIMMDDFAMLDVSSGLGLGVFSGGQLLVGDRGLAGELGHITVAINGNQCGCGNRGCLETYATDTAFLNALSDRLQRPIQLDDAIQRILNGELDASQELDQMVEYLSVACSAVINIFNPSRLFIHGELLNAMGHLFPRVLERTQQRALSPSLEHCQLIQARGSKRQGAVSGIIQFLTQSRAPTLI